MRGVAYDTNEQRHQGASADLIGVGDLRFMFEKIGTIVRDFSSGVVDELDGSHLVEEVSLPVWGNLTDERTVAFRLAQLNTLSNSRPNHQVAVAIQVQLRFRDTFLRNPTTTSALYCLEPISTM
jgi:hypothetical protein